MAGKLRLNNREERGRAGGETKFLAFIHDVDGEFVGEISDPYLAGWDGDRLVLTPTHHVASVPRWTGEVVSPR